MNQSKQSQLIERILFVSVTNPFGNSGYANVVRNLLYSLVQSGYQLSCLVGTDSEKADQLRESLEETHLFSLGVYTFNYKMEKKINNII